MVTKVENQIMEQIDLTKVGNNLLYYRKQKGLTQAEVAERARISERTYADIERGKVNMKIDTMLSICHALGITPNEVFYLETNQYLPEMLLNYINHAPSNVGEATVKIMEILMEMYNSKSS